MKNLFFPIALLITVAFVSSCRKSVDACANFDKSAYLVNDTILLNAACSENVGTYLWQPQAGLRMLGTGNTSSERFIVLSLPGAISRTISLTVSNAKSSRTISKSALIL
jgi:hypothetical protein